MRILFGFLFLAFGFSAITQPAGTLLVVNKAENTVSLIDLGKGSIVATIDTEFGPHEVAVSLSGEFAAITNYGNGQTASNSISVIDIVQRKKLKTIDLGVYFRPHGIEFINEEEAIVTSEARMVLILVNIKSGAVTEVAGTAQQGSHMVAWSAIDNTAYVSNVGSGTVSVIDVPNRKLKKVLNFKPGIEGLDISSNGKELWVANRNDSSVTVVNSANGEVLALLPAHQVAFRVKCLPNGEFVVVSNGLSGNISLYNGKEKKLVKDIDVTGESGAQPVPVGIAIEPTSKYIYVCLAGYNQVVEIETKGWTISRSLNTGIEPDGVYYSKR